MSEILSEVLWKLLSEILAVCALYLGYVVAVYLRKLMEKEGILQKILYLSTKKEIAELAVKFVEQVYKDADGPTKLEKAMSWATATLADMGIETNEEELRGLIERAVLEFKKGYAQGGSNPPG